MKFVTHVYHTPPPTAKWLDVAFIVLHEGKFLLGPTMVIEISEDQIHAELAQGKLLRIDGVAPISDDEVVRISADGRIWISKAKLKWKRENRKIIGFGPELLLAMRELSDIDKVRMQYYLGLHDGTEHSAREAGQKFACSPSLFNGAEKRILRKIRHIRL